MESLMTAIYLVASLVLVIGVPVVVFFVVGTMVEKWKFLSIPPIFLVIWVCIAIWPNYSDITGRTLSNMIVGKEATDVVWAERNRPKPTRIDLRTEIKRAMLVSMNPPKHFYVTLKWEDGSTTQNYVSKHCNKYRDNKIGDMYNIPVTIYKMSDGTREMMEIRGLSKVFCE